MQHFMITLSNICHNDKIPEIPVDLLVIQLIAMLRTLSLLSSVHGSKGDIHILTCEGTTVPRAEDI